MVNVYPTVRWAYLDKEAAQIEWEFAANVERASPMVVMLASMLPLSADELDALFTEAAAF